MSEDETVKCCTCGRKESTLIPALMRLRPDVFLIIQDSGHCRLWLCEECQAEFQEMGCSLGKLAELTKEEEKP